MKIYIVTNEAERYDSSYHDILEVFNTMEKATTCMRTSADDFVTMCDNGDGFDNYTIETEFPNALIIKNDDNDFEYEAWYVDVYEVH